MENAILSISHSSYIHNVGGMEKVILEQCDVANKRGYTFIAVYPNCNNITLKGHVLVHRFQSYGVHINKGEAATMDKQTLQQLLLSYNIEKVFIHSLIAYSFDQINEILKNLPQASMFFYVHDYKSVCDGHNLLKNKRCYCGSDGLKFTKCCNCRFYIPGIISTRRYKQFFRDFPNMKFIFPSQLAKEVWQGSYNYIEENRLIVLPHQVLSTDTLQYVRNDKLRLAYIGYKSFNKGWDVFRKLVEYINNFGCDVDLFVLGKTNEHLPNVQEVEVTFQKDGPDAMVNAIKHHKIDFAFLWSPWPETYSYTFFESYVGGAFILTNANSGNIAACTERFDCGRVFNNDRELFEFFSDEDKLAKLRQQVVVRPKQLCFNSDFIDL